MRAPPAVPAPGGDGKNAVFADAAAQPLGVGADTSACFFRHGVTLSDVVYTVGWVLGAARCCDPP